MARAGRIARSAETAAAARPDAARFGAAAGGVAALAPVRPADAAGPANGAVAGDGGTGPASAPAAAEAGLAALLLAFAAPRLRDRRILLAGRMRAILAEAIAALDDEPGSAQDEDEVTALALAALREELARHDALAAARSGAELVQPVAEAAG